ncbi:hypothetical protein [Roseococcus microcysteis]|uniref:hypothetical protein n=1 Tax=Roseococcus microcysteis TaxID=2771361 RepID=UPI00168BE218|nr:hypothetical protein [Roseococcus microcysteis]
MAHRYVDRLGRVITDPETIEARRLMSLLTRLENKAVKRGDFVTVKELAASAKLEPARVVEIIRSFDMWLWGLTEKGEMADWLVWTDGE